MDRRSFLGIAALAGLARPGKVAAAEGWPRRTVRILVGFAPGGFTDVGARALAQQLSAEFGQSFVVENRSGASGTLATDMAAKAAPDGYTLLFGHSTPNAVAAALFRNLPYDPMRDLRPISQLAVHPHMLVVPASSPYRTVSELVAAAKAKPGTLTYSSSGLGSVHHMASALFAHAAGLELVHVPYRGSAPAMADLIAGRVDMTVDGVGAVGPQIREGKLRALAAGTMERIPSFPDLPTLRELGFGDIDAVSWIGLFGPAGLPDPIALRLEEGVAKALRDPALSKLITDSGARLATRRGAEFRDFIGSEIAAYRAALGGGQISLD